MHEEAGGRGDENEREGDEEHGPLDAPTDGALVLGWGISYIVRWWGAFWVVVIAKGEVEVAAVLFEFCCGRQGGGRGSEHGSVVGNERGVANVRVGVRRQEPGGCAPEISYQGGSCVMKSVLWAIPGSI